MALVAISQQKTLGQLVKEMNDARNKLYTPPNGAWPVYSDAFDVLEGMIDDVKDDLKALYGIKIDSTSPKDATVKVKKSVTLSEEIKTALAAVETKRSEVEDLWLDAYDAWQAYHNTVAAYNSHPHVSPEERLDVPGLDKFVATSLYTCHGPCEYPFETDSLAQVSHQAYCSEKHGTSGTTGVTYYLCSGSCPRSSQHWKECRATSCSVLFPPPENEHEADYYDHKVKCSESVYSALNPNAKCGEEYYTCQNSSCPESNTHWSGSTPPPSPSYHACGVHETSVSGDHSLQASCSASNANGSCTVSGFYACDGHSHVYPSPTLCPANSWTGCGSTTSDATTCGSGHTYYTCNPSAVSWHTADRTCSRTGCNATYTDCSRGSETKHCLGKYKWHK